MISFIHIGKCGGTSIKHLLKGKIKSFKEYHMTKNYTTNEKYIIWIRNPLSRFVSAFNYQYECISFNINEYKGKKLTLNNCISPGYFKFKIRNGYTFDKNFDRLATFFKTPNNLAEALSSNNPTIKRKAIKLMSSNFEHLKKGIGWYLNNGNFVKNNNSRILFVGKLETMKDDIIKLEKLLNISLDNKTHIRKNTAGDTYLSELAIQNLLEWYKETDYKAINELHINGWITKEILESYYRYENKI
jgi:hypothetical protein